MRKIKSEQKEESLASNKSKFWTIRKKGTIDDFGDLFVGVLIITVLLIIFLVFISYFDSQAKIYTNIHIKLQETSRSTRLMLDQETDSGQKIYSLIVQQKEKRDYVIVAQELNKTLNRVYGPSRGTWFIFIDDGHAENIEYLTNDPSFKQPKCLSELPKVNIPDGKGGIIKVIIKKLDSSDHIYCDIDWNNLGGPY